MSIIFADGRYVPDDRPIVPATDQAVLWGIGLFEVTRAYDGVAFRLADHLSRLRRSARRFGLRGKVPPLDRAVRALLRRNGLRDGYVRVTLTQGRHLMVIVRPWSPPPAATYRDGAALLTLPWRRDPRSPIYGHKTLNYYENMLGRWDARKKGAVDALFLGPDGEVLEGTASNVFLVRRGRLITPSLGSSVLPGVTRGIVLASARAVGIRVEERPVFLKELLLADEVFVTNSLIEVMPVAKVDARRIGRPGPLTLDLAHAYGEAVAKECGA